MRDDARPLTRGLIPRRRDGAQVIGEALHLAAGGAGHRVIARQPQRPEDTVRDWLRAGRRRAESLLACATRWTCTLDPEPGAITPTGSELADAVEAIMHAVRASVLRLGPSETSASERAVSITGGLLCGRSTLPP